MFKIHFTFCFRHTIKKRLLESLFLNSQIFFASSLKLLSCCSSSWANVVPFEHGWSYRKNSNAGKFVFSYRFIYKNFQLVRDPVFCQVSGFCTSDGFILTLIIQFCALIVFLIKRSKTLNSLKNYSWTIQLLVKTFFSLFIKKKILIHAMGNKIVLYSIE